MAGLAGESVLRQEPGQHRLGPLLRRRHRRTGGRRARHQPASQPRTARRARARSSPNTNTTSNAGPRHLHAAHLPAQRRQANETNAIDERNFSPRLDAPEARGSAARWHQPGDRTPRTNSRACRSARAPCRSPTATSSTYFLHDIRPRRARDRLLLRSEDGAEPRPGAAPAERRHDDEPDRSGQGRRRTCSKAGKTPEQIVDELYLRCFSRKPDDHERAEACSRTSPQAGDKPQQILEDIFWALLNSKEFMFNH